MENYENVHQIGEGTYGTVYRCFVKGSKQAVAIKKFKESDQGDNQVMKTALREVSLLRSLADHHENIVTLLDVFRHRGKLCLVFEYVESTVLQLLQRTPGGLSEPLVKRVIWQLLRALEFLHAHGIMHRDVKPENLLVSSDGLLKLCDFGFARRLQEDTATVRRYTSYVATRWYRAPELLLRKKDYGPAVDVWAVGCLVAEMLTGHPAFPGRTDADQLSLVLACVGSLPQTDADGDVSVAPTQPVRSVRSRYAHFGNSLVDFMEQCLHPDATQRPSVTQLMSHPWLADTTSWMTSDFQASWQHAREEAKKRQAQMLRQRRTHLATADVLQIPRTKDGSASSAATHITVDARAGSSAADPHNNNVSVRQRKDPPSTSSGNSGVKGHQEGSAQKHPASHRLHTSSTAGDHSGVNNGEQYHAAPRRAPPMTAHAKVPAAAGVSAVSASNLGRGSSSTSNLSNSPKVQGRSSPYLVKSSPHKQVSERDRGSRGVSMSPANKPPSTSPSKRSAMTRDGYSPHNNERMPVSRGRSDRAAHSPLSSAIPQRYQQNMLDNNHMVEEAIKEEEVPAAPVVHYATGQQQQQQEVAHQPPAIVAPPPSPVSTHAACNVPVRAPSLLERLLRPTKASARAAQSRKAAAGATSKK